MNSSFEDFLLHYGMPRRSGRYPWGSGKNPYQHSGDFVTRVRALKKEGMSETEIAEYFGLSTTQLRAQYGLAKDEYRSFQVATVKALKEKGYSNVQIAEKMGLPGESSVRSLLNSDSEARMSIASNTADFLKKQIDEKGVIDVGKGVEKELGVSKEKLNEALYLLELDGYKVGYGRVPQVTDPSKQTTLRVVGPPDMAKNAAYDYENIHSVTDYISYDGGDTFKPAFQYPASMDSNRLTIRYAEDGGVNKDGLIEIRRGVKDLSLGESVYAQVRILVDGDKYLKGMAVYTDDLPDGIDIRFNTNKTKDVSKRDVLKDIKKDPNNPFGSLIKERGGQSYYTDDDGNEKLSLINKRAEEGDWDSWKNKLPSQFLGKQNESLIRRQLNLDLENRRTELSEIESVNNPVVKKALLGSFADDCDANAVHLKAAALPRQRHQVILPLENISDKEIYAPNYKQGETVALVRYPHGGTFEIPILTVNNRNKEGRKVLGDSPLDAVGINKNVADRLSGADFDGDTVMVIPCNSPNSSVKITSRNPLKGLEGFDPKLEYGHDSVKVDSNGTKHYYRGGIEFKPMKNTQTEMGKISNLITDMTLKGASDEDKVKAVRHSMVVIDAEKHGLDYKRSEVENSIPTLVKKYQTTTDEKGNVVKVGGASTLLSRAGSETRVPKRQGSPVINPDGSVSYKTADEDKLYYTDKSGKRKMRTTTSTQMAETSDARTLSSGTVAENLYAGYANTLKGMGNYARKTMINTGKLQQNSAAKETYSTEVKSLDSKLELAEKNIPKERRAQTLANATIKAKQEEYPDMTKDELKKIKQQALTDARNQVGASGKDTRITLTDKEWEAIQAGAISDTKLSRIVRFADMDDLKTRATPRSTANLPAATIGRITSLANSGYTTAEIADALGLSSATVRKYL